MASILNLSGVNSLLSSYSQINSVKLNMALNGTAAKNLLNSSAVSGTTSTGKSTGFSTDDAKFLDTYKAKLTDLKTAANNVLSPTASKNKLAAGSSSSSVAAVTGNLQKNTDTYKVNVERLASNQVNRSSALKSDETLPSMSGKLTLKTEKGSFDLYLSAAGSKTNAGMLGNFAGKINASGAGITAKVVEKDGQSMLELSGEGAFSVSGSLGERLGLDQVTQEQQDAVYTVSKNGGTAQQYTSSSNSVKLEGDLQMTLKAAGETTVQAGQSESDRQADAMAELVSSFNSTLSYLNENGERGVGVLNTMRRMIEPPTSERSMEKIGLSIKSDGSLSFDRSKFLSALESDQESGSTLSKSIVENVARGIRNDAVGGLQESSYSLVGKTASSGGSSSVNSLLSQNSYDMDTINMMSTYNRSGVYNMMNLNAVGALLSISF